MKSFDVVVIGAGPAGASAAFFLAKKGLQVAVIEKSNFPRRKVCGEFVSATSLPLLEAMGCMGKLEPVSGPPVTKVAIFAGDSAVSAPMPAVVGGVAGRSISRESMDPMLLEAAHGQGAEVFQPWKALDLESDGDGHTCTIKAGELVEQLRASVLVIAHGSWEVGTLSTQVAKIHEPRDLLAFKAFLKGGHLEEGLMALLAFRGGYGGMVHCHGGVVGLSGCLRRDVLQEVRKQRELGAGENFLEYVSGSTRAVGEALSGAELLGKVVAAGPLRPGIRKLYENGIFRVGNAAGEAHPVIAEGISMAIQSGFLLAQALQEECRPFSRQHLDRAGRNYASAWMNQFGGRIRAANAIARLSMTAPAHKLLGPVIRAFPGIITAGAAFSGKTKAIAL